MSKIDIDIELFKELIEIPVKPFRTLIKKYHKGVVNKDSCIYLRNFVFYFAEQISLEAAEEFKKYNAKRVINDLSKCKRLEIFFVKQAIDKLFLRFLTEKLEAVGNSHKWKEAVEIYEERNRISREIARENEINKERYGD